MRLLLVEDHELLADTVADGLRREGMAVDVAYNGRAALVRSRVIAYDVIVLDRDLPEIHGDEVCRALVADGSESRVLMLTAADAIEDRIEGLGLGADDYLPKPFDFGELVARIRALARRSGRSLPPTLEHGDLNLDPARRVAVRGGRRLVLRPKEFGVLECLLAAQGRVTARLRLSLLYGGLFLVCGAGLLAITYGLVRANVPATVTVPGTPTTSALPQRARSHPAPLPLGHPHNRPAGTPESPASQVAVAVALRQKQVDLSGELLWSAVALAIMTLVSFGLGWYVAGRVLRPVRTIARTARTISARNLGERLALDGPDDEFKELGDTLDDLFARLQAAFDSQRHFVANASHELRTPLTVERSLLQIALSDPSPTVESLLVTCQNALLNSEQQQHLIDGLLTLARSEGGLDNREPCNLEQIIEQVLMTPRTDVDRLGLTIDTTLQPAPVAGNPRLLERLASNLVENAIHHNTLGGHVEITAGTRHQHAFLTITNTGPVIPANDVQRLFQPFQRLNGTRTQHNNGHGLGLSIVQAIATAHDATITTQAQPDGGLAIQVSFPRSEKPARTPWAANACASMNAGLAASRSKRPPIRQTRDPLGASGDRRP